MSQFDSKQGERKRKKTPKKEALDEEKEKKSVCYLFDAYISNLLVDKSFQICWLINHFISLGTSAVMQMTVFRV